VTRFVPEGTNEGVLTEGMVKKEKAREPVSKAGYPHHRSGNRTGVRRHLKFAVLVAATSGLQAYGHGERVKKVEKKTNHEAREV